MEFWYKKIRNDIEAILNLDYHKIIRIDLTHDKYEIITSQEKVPSKKGKFSERLNTMIDKVVIPNDQKDIKALTDLERLRKLISDDNIVDFTYTRYFGKGEEVCNMEFILIPSCERTDKAEYGMLYIKYLD